MNVGIISSHIVWDIAQASGDRYIRFQYEFDDGRIITIDRGQQPLAYDANTGLTDGATEAETQVIEQEEQELNSQIVNSIIDPLDAVPYHPTSETQSNRTRRYRRRLIRWIAAEVDMKIARLIFYPVWYWAKFDSGYTNTQIANYLNISMTTLSRINSRFQAFHDNLTFLDGDDSYIGEIED